MKLVKRIVNSKYFMAVLWAAIIIVIWEIFAFIVQYTKRTPVNILPHLTGIIESIFSQKTINGSQTALQMVLINAGATLSRAGIGFLIGTAIGFLLALLMSLSGTVEKIAFPYLMLIQMIPVLGMAPIILALTGDISISRIVIAAILTFYPVATNTLSGIKRVQKDKNDRTDRFHCRSSDHGCFQHCFKLLSGISGLLQFHATGGSAWSISADCSVHEEYFTVFNLL